MSKFEEFSKNLFTEYMQDKRSSYDYGLLKEAYNFALEEAMNLCESDEWCSEEMKIKISKLKEEA